MTDQELADACYEALTTLANAMKRAQEHGLVVNFQATPQGQLNLGVGRPLKPTRLAVPNLLIS